MNNNRNRGLGLGCLTALSTLFQLFSILLVEKTTDLPQVTDKYYHVMLYRVHLYWAGFELTLMVMRTGDIGSCKFNYQTTTTTAVSIIEIG